MLQGSPPVTSLYYKIIQNRLPKSYLETAGVEGAKAETEVAARVRAARVRRGAMVEVYEVKS